MMGQGRKGFVIGCLFLIACNTTKHIPEGDALYKGATIKLSTDNTSVREKKVLQQDLNTLTRPRPNGSFFGIPFKLLLWNLFYTTKTKGLKHSLQQKLGEPPVLASSVHLDVNVKLLQNHSENKGFFQTTASADSSWKNKKATVTYTVKAGSQYKIRNVSFANDSSQLSQAIADIGKKTFLKPGQPYDLDLIQGERTRIDALLKERGFYYFSPDFLLAQVDSTVGNRQVDIKVIVKPDAPNEAREVYYINDVYIYDNYSLNRARQDTNKSKATFYQGYYVVDQKEKYKPKLFSYTMKFKPNDVYNRTDHNQSLQRLMNLNTFKFVKNRFERAATDSAKLNTYYYLTPFPEKAIRAEVGTSTRSDNLNGSDITFGYTQRNTFRAAEQMDIRLYAGTDVQFSGAFQNTSTFRYGGQVDFAIPRFVTPFFHFQPKSSYIPKTNIQLGYEALDRRTLYTINSVHGAFGYLWKESISKSHEFYPISITYTKPLNTSQTFKNAQSKDPTLLHIVDTQFVLGSTYQYNYNQQAAGLQKINSFYFNGLVDISGNVAGLLVNNKDPQNRKQLFNLPFAQYGKLELDGRYYRRVGLNMTWANRVIVGYGIPYGNSRELPYIKQFFIGGSNSLRGFQSRTVGPGTYLASDSLGFIPDQTGDLKLEINTELRPKISGPLYGAIFIDAGNIWLANDNPNKPGATITGNFLKELAMDAGVGIRVDIQLFVIRLDAAFPIRKPWLAAGQRSVINQLNFGDPTWRSNNLVYNLAIGYPF